MDTRQAYNEWAQQYDGNANKTRDLEARALRTSLAGLHFDNCLEIGCGTGKNTEWLISRAGLLSSVDFSAGMLALAKEKIKSEKVQFIQADISAAWTFRKQFYELVSFSLVLEHIEDLDHVLKEAADSLVPGGHVYIGELHPFKQYSGTKARYESEAGQQVLECFVHNLSDFIQIAKKHGLYPVDINEYFDENDRTRIPRILTILLQKDSKSDQNQWTGKIR